jgi:predicted ester cyclase
MKKVSILNLAALIMTFVLIAGCQQQTKNETTMNNEAYTKTMDRLIADVWNNQNLDILAEVFTEDAELHLGGLDYNLKGIPNFRENYMRTTMIAFPDIQHGYDELIIDGNMIAMMFYGEGTHKEEYDGIPATNKVLR